MTGSQPSIRRRLLALLIPSVMLLWLVVLVLVYRAAGHEIEEVFDRNLERSGRVLQALLLHEVAEERETALRARAVADEIGRDGMQRYPLLAATLREYIDDVREEQLGLIGAAQHAGTEGQGLTFVARHADGRTMLRDRAAPDIPPAEEGFTDLQLSGQTWRVFSLTDERSGFLVQTGEPLHFRAELVGYITRNTLAPMLIALPLLGAIIWGVVGGALSSLRRTAEVVSRRAPGVLEPIDPSQSPTEIQPLLQALNDLFSRMRAAIRREQQFTADAAHELRTPLAALKTHLQVARGKTAEQTTRESLDLALDGLDRASHSVEQLLALARADARDGDVLASTPVELHELAVWAVSALSQKAYERDIDLGLAEAQHAEIMGDITALRTLLRNLVDNAIRYTPRGGTVTVAVGEDHEGKWIEVLDDGMGVSSGEQSRLFDRFHRGPEGQAMTTTGSGLGLSIVQRIARLHRATIRLGAGLGNRGLGVRILFPDRPDPSERRSGVS